MYLTFLICKMGTYLIERYKCIITSNMLRTVIRHVVSAQEMVAIVIGRIMLPTPEDADVLVSATCENDMLHSKWELRVQLELRLLIS